MVHVHIDSRSVARRLAAVPTLFASLAMAVSLCACHKSKPSEADCYSFADNLIKVYEDEAIAEGRPAKLKAKHRDDLATACARHGKREEVLCAAKAETVDALAECKF